VVLHRIKGMGQKFVKTQLSSKPKKSFQEIAPNPLSPSQPNIQRRYIPPEELNAFQTEETQIVENMYQVMKQYSVQENPNAATEKGLFIEPTLEDKIKMAKLMDSTFDEEKYLLSREVRAARRSSTDEASMYQYMSSLQSSIRVKNNDRVINGVKLTKFFNQYHKMTLEKLETGEIISGICSHNKIAEHRVKDMIKYYDIPVWTFDKKIVDMKIGYDRTNPEPHS